MFLPYKLESSDEDLPLATMILISVLVAIYILVNFTTLLYGFVGDMILLGLEWPGIILHIFFHVELSHLFGNCLFLWIFGGAINARIGNVLYLLVFIMFGLCAAIVHSIFDNAPAIGASGAIYGMLGLSICLFPLNKINFFWFSLSRTGNISIPAIVPIVLWVATDVFGLYNSVSNTSHIAHLGGFMSGLIAGLYLTLLNRVPVYTDDLPMLPELISSWLGRR